MDGPREIRPSGPPPPSGITGVIVGFLATVLVAWIGANLLVEGKWFAAIGHPEVFRLVVTTKLMVGLGVAVFVGGVLWFNLTLALRLSRGMQPLHLHDPDGVPRVDLGVVVERLIRPAAVVVALFSGLVQHTRWELWQRAIHATDFGTADPIFGNDVGFYVLRLPLLTVVTSLLLWTAGLTAAGSGAVYITRGAVRADALGATPKAARAHLTVLAAIIMAILAANAYLDVFHILFSTVGPMTGASYADVHATLPTQRVKVAVAAVGAVLMLASIGRDRLTLPIAAIVLYMLSQFAVQAYAPMVHRFVVVPNEFDKEQRFLGYNIAATRAAYGLDKVEERELSADTELTADDIAANADTIDNVRLWDHEPLLDTFAQIQEIRTYYDFHAVDNDRYMIDGKLRQTMLSPRELSTASLPSRTWINERFTFTHGYGLTLGPVNEATEEGLPVLFVQDIPPASSTPSIKVTRPSIYYGELSNDYAFVHTRTPEFHHPTGDGSVETEYDGKGGMRFESFLLRLAVAWRLGDLKMLLSDDIDSGSRVLLHRNIEDRVRHVVPFAELDEDPYMVVRDDGTLLWIFDAYLTSTTYPNAERMAGFGTSLNYIRNSIKITVDAYDGTVTVYAVDTSDPLLKTWQEALPELFTPMDKMPPDVRAHLRHPQAIFEMQTEIFTTYHMGDAQLIYNREDQWQVPTVSSGETRQRMTPYYTVMRLPGEKEAEFIQMLPFVPKRKDNMAAWMVARADGDKLGQLVVYRFPKDRLIFGPQQIVNRINQDAEISRQISLWDQRGSEAIFGTLLVIPIEASLLYVRPLYLRSEGGKIPELKRVVVAYGKQIAMKASLREAIEDILPASGRTGTAEVPQPAETGGDDGATKSTAPAAAAMQPSPANMPGRPGAEQALHHFERAIGAQRQGHWAQYGEELERVEQLLRDMQPPAPAPAPAPAPPQPDSGTPSN